MICKSLKSNKYWATLTVVGIATLIFCGITYKSMSSDTHNLVMLNGMFFGVGVAFTAMGLFKLILNKRTPAEKLKAKEIEAKDERNIQILRISYSVANTLAIILFATMAFLFMGLDYIIPAFISLGAMFIHLLSVFIALKYYNRKM